MDGPVGIPQPIQARAEATVSVVIEATIKAIEAHGEASVRIDDILQETGISKGSLYHHFGGREGLIAAARVMQFSRFVAEDAKNIRETLTKTTTLDEFVAATSTLPSVTVPATTVCRSLRVRTADPTCASRSHFNSIRTPKRSPTRFATDKRWVGSAPTSTRVRSRSSSRATTLLGSCSTSTPSPSQPKTGNRSCAWPSGRSSSRAGDPRRRHTSGHRRPTGSVVLAHEPAHRL